MSHLYNLLQSFAWWGGNTCHLLTHLIQTACSSAVVHPHPDIYWEEMWPFHYVSSAGVCILVVSPATMMSNAPPKKKKVKRDSCIPQVSGWFIFSINYQSSVLIPRCCTGEGCVKVIKVSQFIEWNEEEEEELRRVLQTRRSGINRLLVLPVNLQPGSMFIFE